MNKNKKRLISGLTVAGFLAASYLPAAGGMVFAADKSAADQKVEQPGTKDGSCSGSGGCSGMKKKKKVKKEEAATKQGSCSGMKKEEAPAKQGSCTAMKK